MIIARTSALAEGTGDSETIAYLHHGSTGICMTSSGDDGLVGEVDKTELTQNDLVTVLQLLAVYTLPVHVCAVQTARVDDGDSANRTPLPLWR